MKVISLKPFRLCADKLTYNSSEDILLKNSRLVIPTALQERAAQLAHVGHQGIEKTKSLVPQYGQTSERNGGQSVGNSNNREPMEITPTEDKPWTSIAIDFYGPIPKTGQYLWR